MMEEVNFSSTGTEPYTVQKQLIKRDDFTEGPRTPPPTSALDLYDEPHSHQHVCFARVGIISKVTYRLGKVFRTVL